MPRAKLEVSKVEMTFAKLMSERAAVVGPLLRGSPAVNATGDPAKHAGDPKSAVVLQLDAVMDVDGPAHMRVILASLVDNITLIVAVIGQLRGLHVLEGNNDKLDTFTTADRLAIRGLKTQLLSSELANMSKLMASESVHPG
jgi:hypothetical protein